MTTNTKELVANKAKLVEAFNIKHHPKPNWVLQQRTRRPASVPQPGSPHLRSETFPRDCCPSTREGREGELSHRWRAAGVFREPALDKGTERHGVPAGDRHGWSGKQQPPQAQGPAVTRCRGRAQRERKVREENPGFLRQTPAFLPQASSTGSLGIFPCRCRRGDSGDQSGLTNPAAGGARENIS